MPSGCSPTSTGVSMTPRWLPDARPAPQNVKRRRVGRLGARRAKVRLARLAVAYVLG